MHLESTLNTIANFDKPVQRVQAFVIFHILFEELFVVRRRYCSRIMFGMQQLSDVSSNIYQKMNLNYLFPLDIEKEIHQVYVRCHEVDL